MAEDIVIRARIELEKASRQLKDFQSRLGKTARISEKSYKLLAEKQSEVAKATDKLNASMGKTPFKGYALSVMFAGMALQNFFLNTWQTASKTFNDIMHSVEGTTTGFDILAGSVTYLQFVIGQALEPVAAWLAPIIDSVADWISENQELTTTILLIVGALGVVLTSFGFITLAVTGIIDTLAVFGITGASVANSVGAAFAGISLGAAAGIFAALLIAWQTDLGNIKAWAKSSTDLIQTGFNEGFESIKQTVSAGWGLVKAIFEADTEGIHENSKRFFDGLIDLAMTQMATFVSVQINAVLFLYNLLVDITKSISVMLVESVRQSMLNLLAVVNAGRRTFGLSELKDDFSDDFKKVEDSIKNTAQGLKADYIGQDTLKEFIDGTKQMTDAIFSLEKGLTVVEKASVAASGNPYVNYTPMEQQYNLAPTRWQNVEQPQASGYGPNNMAPLQVTFNIQGMTMDSVRELSTNVSASIWQQLSARVQ